jgi:hypothetical protein
VLATGAILLLLISGFRLVESAGRKHADPFTAIQMLDWCIPDQWRYAR